MEAIQGATVEEMQALPGMNRKAAEAVFQFFREMEGK
jgi:DNA uptake protein ComE-like DNA-binding protein